MSALADQYERRYPGALEDTSHKEERMERLLFKEEAQSGRRSNRNRGVIFERLPLDEKGRLRP